MPNDELQPGSAGFVRTQYFTFAEPPNEMLLDSGEKLGPITLAYETYGQLNETKSNAILILHALSGDAHAAGISMNDDGVSAIEPGIDGTEKTENFDRKRLGWWDNMIGPGKGFDTDKYFVIASNVLGGCRGSTGPSSINTKTGKVFGPDFPVVTIGDMVRAQTHLVDHFGIKKLLAVAGGSMGGMQALEWAKSYPERIRACMAIASCALHSAQGIAFNEVGRQAIMGDPNWRGGRYYDQAAPDTGLALARMIGHITYLSDQSMHNKFGRRLRGSEKYGYDFSTEFEVESYLHHQGGAFTKRFDANSYLYITKAIDYFDLSNGHGDLSGAFGNTNTRYLVISFTSDWLYPSYQSKDIVRAIKSNGGDVTYYEVDSPYGHDAFLLEEAVQMPLIAGFLASTYSSIGGPQYVIDS
jgi:homoserine O-acetyltransferase